MEHRGLAGAARQAVGLRGVLAVLDHIEIEPPHVGDAEVEQLLVDQVEVVILIGLHDLLLQPMRASDRPTVQRDHVTGLDLVPRRIKPFEVGQQEARGVADASVGIGGALEDLLRHRHLGAVVGRRDPQPDDVGTQGLHHRLRRHHVAERLGHLLAVGVDSESMRQHTLVRCMPRHRH